MKGCCFHAHDLQLFGEAVGDRYRAVRGSGLAVVAVSGSRPGWFHWRVSAVGGEGNEDEPTGGFGRLSCPQPGEFDHGTESQTHGPFDETEDKQRQADDVDSRSKIPHHCDFPANSEKSRP